MGNFIHKLADVQSDHIGTDTRIWQFVIVLPKAAIGRDCNINAHVLIENDVTLGDRVTIKPGVQVWDGMRIEDDVFIGPNVTFTNDLRPRSKRYPDEFLTTRICKGATLGANATILPGLTIGSYAMVAAGALVSKDVPERALMVGAPAKVRGWLNMDGSRMTEVGGKEWQDNQGKRWVVYNNRLVEKDA